tara:strand:+ start:1112 stop:1711 length:600 start_codon:yes stop_codon:yes gene_type:complete
MKSIVTYIIIFILALMNTSCLKEQISSPLESDKLTYEYLPDQPYTVDITIIPTEDVEVFQEDMLLEVNADYFNRYGIAINGTVTRRELLPDEVKNGRQIFFPKNISGGIKVYIVPQEYVKMPSSLAYAELYSSVIVLGEEVQKNRTLAHEIAHLLGLKHTSNDECPNNVMTPKYRAGQYGKPNDFTPEQVETMKSNITD